MEIDYSLSKGNWKRVDQESLNKMEKRYLTGSGSFKNEYGEESINGQALVRKWDDKVRGFLTLFSAFWNTIVFVVFGSIFASKTFYVNDAPYSSLANAVMDNPFIFVFLIFPVIGLFTAYLAASMWINKTTISYNFNHIEIKKGPLPWKNSHVKIATNNISQCWVETYSSYSQNDVPIYVFRVMASRKRGKPIVIESGMRHYGDARILEQWLENKLGIEDQSVPGEYVA